MAAGEFEILNLLEALLKTYWAANLGEFSQAQARTKPVRDALAQLRDAFEEAARSSGAPSLTPELLYELLRLHLRTTDSALALMLGAQRKAQQPPSRMSVQPSLELQGVLGERACGELEVKNEGKRAREVHLGLGYLRASEGEPFEVKAGFLDREGLPLRGALSVEADELGLASLWVELDPKVFEAGRRYEGALVAEDQDGVQETMSVVLTVLPVGGSDGPDGGPSGGSGGGPDSPDSGPSGGSDGGGSGGGSDGGGPHGGDGGGRLEQLEAKLEGLQAQLEAQNKQQALLLEQLSRFLGGSQGGKPAEDKAAAEDKPVVDKPVPRRRPKSGGGQG